jgi:hypothetical protein
MKKTVLASVIVFSAFIALNALADRHEKSQWREECKESNTTGVLNCCYDKRKKCIEDANNDDEIEECKRKFKKCQISRIETE